MQATIFSVGDEGYFVGTVGLINSLRLTGHDGEIVILDCGFTPDQREILDPVCTLKRLDDDRVTSFRGFLKPIAPLTHQSDHTIVIDSDVIVTSRLDEIIASAAAGNIVAYADPESDRWFAEWKHIFQLPELPRRDVYVCSAVVGFSRSHHPEFLQQWCGACQRILTVPTVNRDGATGPTSQADQDALNAVLMSSYPEGTVDLRPVQEAPQASALRKGVDIDDPRTLRCSNDGQPTRLLHSAGRPKPWVRLGARKTAYTILLARLLDAEDVPIRVPRPLIPSWLRSDHGSVAYLTALDAYSRTRASISRRVEFLPRSMRARISRLLP
jgi:hypothetical protein